MSTAFEMVIEQGKKDYATTVKNLPAMRDAIDELIALDVDELFERLSASAAKSEKPEEYMVSMMQMLKSLESTGSNFNLVLILITVLTKEKE